MRPFAQRLVSRLQCDTLTWGTWEIRSLQSATIAKYTALEFPELFIKFATARASNSISKALICKLIHMIIDKTIPQNPEFSQKTGYVSYVSRESLDP